MRLARASAPPLVAIACAMAGGCGEAAVHSHTISHATSPHVAQAGASTAASGVAASSAAAAKRRSIVARIDASSDAIVAEGKLHIAPGAPSDAEVRREIAEARKAGVVLPSGDNVESFAAGSTYSATATA